VRDSTAELPAIELRTPQDADRARKLINELFKVVFNLRQKKSIDQATARTHMAFLTRAHIEAGINVYLRQAKQARSEGKGRVAIHFYKCTLAELAKHNESGIYNDAIQKYQDQLHQLKVEEQQKRAATQSALEQGMQEDQARGLDDPISSDDKKYY
jgi:hypothetical protein